MVDPKNPSTEIYIPRETVNDDFVTVQAWLVPDGAQVFSGQKIAEIETSKTIFEIEAPSDGYLQILYPQAAEAPVGQSIGRIVSEISQSQAAILKIEASEKSPMDGDVISKKAQKLMEQYGITPNVFAGKGLIRENDVIKFLEADRSRPQTMPERGRDVESTSKKTRGYRHKGLLGDLAVSAGERNQNWLWVALNYFWRNWFLGHLVKIAPRGFINLLHRLRGVKMGRDCFIDPSAILETAYPENITLGDDVRVTVGAIIMTHIKAPHYLRETGIMPPVIKPVKLGSHSFVGVNATIMPGVNVGEAAVINSGAVVIANVPPYSMVSGNPAKVIKHFPEPS